MREAGLLEAEEATWLTTDEHRSRLTGTEAEAQMADDRAMSQMPMTDLPSTASTMSMSICDEALRCDDDVDELAAATSTTAT